MKRTHSQAAHGTGYTWAYRLPCVRNGFSIQNKGQQSRHGELAFSGIAPIWVSNGDPLVKVLGGGGLPTVPPISGTISVRVDGGVEIGTGGHRNRYRGMVTLDRASDTELSNSDNA